MSLGLSLFMMVVAISVSQASPVLLVSKAALKAECLKNVTSASVWIGGSGVAENSSSTSSQWIQKSSSDYDCSDLLNSISGQEMSFEVARPQDQINVYVGLYDKNGNQLFYGYKTGYLETQKGGGYSLPWDLTVINVRMSENVSIPLSAEAENAEYAQINVRDESGQIVMNEWLTVENGQLSLPTQYAGSKGELIINYYSNGQFWQRWYDLTTGELIPQDQVLARVYTFVKGYYNFGNNPWSISFGISEQSDGISDNPLVKFTVADDEIMVPMSCSLYDHWGNQKEIAYAVNYRKVGDSVWTEQAVEPEGQALLSLPKGTYQAFFRFKLMKESNPTPIDWGGKG